VNMKSSPKINDLNVPDGNVGHSVSSKAATSSSSTNESPVNFTAPLLPAPAATTPPQQSLEDKELLEPNQHGFPMKLFKMITEVDHEVIAWEDGANIT